MTVNHPTRNPSTDHHLTRRAALQGTVAVGALALPAGAAGATPTSNPDIPGLVAAYHKARRAFRRAYDRLYRIEQAAWIDAEDLFLQSPLVMGSVFDLVHDYGFDGIIPDAPSEFRGWNDDERAVIEHFNAHRDEIRDDLERRGWFKADRSMERAAARLESAYSAVMAAPVATPADVLAKLQVRHPDVWTADFSEVDGPHHPDKKRVYGLPFIGTSRRWPGPRHDRLRCVDPGARPGRQRASAQRRRSPGRHDLHRGRCDVAHHGAC